MGYDYIVPSENGNRSDVEWIAFRPTDGGGKTGMMLLADPGSNFCFSTLLYSANEIHDALHTCDLEPRKNGVHPIHVNIDHRIMGVGGDVR